MRKQVFPHAMRGWEIALLVLGAPLWLPLLLAAFAVLLSLYIVLWLLVLCLWATAVSLAVGSLGACAIAVLYMAGGRTLAGLAALGAGVFCAGLSLFLILGCIAATKGVCRLTKTIALRVKNACMRKEAAQ